MGATARVHARSVKPVRDRDDARFRLAPEAGFVRVADTYFENDCASADWTPAGFQAVRLEPGISRFTLGFRGSDGE